MSTRIHKAMGWGAVHPDRQWLWDRLDSGAKDGEVNDLVTSAYDRMKAAGDEGYRSLGFHALYPAMTTREHKRYPKRFEVVVHYADHPDQEGALTLLVPPMDAASWYRFDDMLDYAEVQALGLDDPLVTVTKELPYPPYPYLSWMDPVTGEAAKNYRDMGGFREHYVGKHGHAPVPDVPIVIRLIAEELRFPDWKTLRPYLCTWWC